MKTILAIDDKPSIVMLIKTKLEANGYNVLSAYSGKKGIEIAREEQPTMILLDVMMPEMDGFDVFKNLKADEKTAKIPVVFLTASGKRSDEEKALEWGAKGFLTKPFSPNNLLEVVQKICGGEE
jgi:CheY-like chemotaxis protein